MKIIRPDIGLLTAKCIDLSLLIDYSTYFKELSIQSGVRLIEGVLLIRGTLHKSFTVFTCQVLRTFCVV